MKYNLEKIMLKKIIKSSTVQNILGWIISCYIKTCYHTSLWLVKDGEIIEKLLSQKKSFLVFFWHNRLLMAPYCWESEKQQFKMLISSHSDGKITSNAVSYFGIFTITGSARKNTLSSIKTILSEINRNNIIGITPDGPRGPAERIKPGLISLIRKTGITVVPLSCSAKFKINLNTWDKFRLVTPFNKFVTVWGNPLIYNEKKDFQDNTAIFEEEINRVSNLSDNLTK